MSPPAIAKGPLSYDGVTAELKFAVASATGRTRCGEFVDQTDERKPIALVISDPERVSVNLASDQHKTDDQLARRRT